MKVIEPYIEYLENLTENVTHSSIDISKIELALNGELSKTLRNLVPKENLQEAGAYFTSENMADDLIGNLLTECECINNITILDSACGGGNLLLAAARKLPIEANLIDTLERWSHILKGIDIHEEFVRATRSRLILLATLRGIDTYGSKFIVSNQRVREDIFQKCIFSANSLEIKWPEATTYLLNPPFNSVPVPKEYKWTSGKISQAALFIIKALKEAKEGTLIKAILPDVLRSGSRYKKWRLQVESSSTIEEIKIIGQFDTKTQVDVFILTIRVGLPIAGTCPNWLKTSHSPSHNFTIKTYCEVKVGRVVPHRDDEVGENYPYLDVNHIPQWRSIYPNQHFRKFAGKTFITPFVVVRRNSRSKDTHRAVGTTVLSETEVEQSVAIENHLIVIKPKPEAEITCDDILNNLRDERTSNWLNERIRCRHLTVDSIQTIPWWNHE